MSISDQITALFRRNRKFDALRIRRMSEDRAKILDVGTWPNVVMLCLKHQPWVAGEDFGDIWLGDLQAGEFIVRDKMDQSKVVAQFANVNDLVKFWSVD